MTSFSVLPGLSASTPADAPGASSSERAAGGEFGFAGLLAAEPSASNDFGGGFGHGRFGGALAGNADPLALAVTASLADDTDSATDMLAVLAWLPWMQQQAEADAATDAMSAAASDAALTPSTGVPATTAPPVLAAPIPAALADSDSLANPSLAAGRQPAPPADNLSSNPPILPIDTQPRPAQVAAALAAVAIVPPPRADRLPSDVLAPEPRVDLRLTEAPPTPRADPPRPSFELSLPPSASNRFAPLQEAIDSRLQWMAERGIGRAQIRLSPAELGQIDIRLETDGKKVRAEFVSNNADVRQALESQLPRLREMFLAQGMTLTHADVGQGDTTGDRKTSASPGQGDGIDSLDDNDAGTAPVPIQHRHVGLLDEYA
jgi:flagellar hook-length control protein FliK